MNSLELDAHARVNGMAELASATPLLISFVFAAAFPLLAHAWLFAVVAASGWSLGFVETVTAIYTMNFTFASAGGNVQFLFFCIVWGSARMSP